MVKTHEWHAPKGQKHIAQGSALGIMVNIISNAPCKGNTLIIRLLPLQGGWRCGDIMLTQGAALGYVIIGLSARL